MSQFLRWTALAGLGGLLAFVACNSSPTATSPSTSPSPVASSSRISGSFVSGATGFAPLRTQTAFEGITVYVKQNTQISVEVRSNGTFTLDGVPTGTVVLVFTRDGASLGEVTIGGVGAGDEVRILLQLTANDTVVLLEVQRQSEDDNSEDSNSKDDDSDDSELELELDPDKWCPEWANGGRPEDDPVFATIKGDGIADVVLTSIMLAGPSGQVVPASATLKGDRIEVIFENAEAIKVVSGVAEGQKATVRIKGLFKDGTSWELKESIRVKCKKDDGSDDQSSG